MKYLYLVLVVFLLAACGKIEKHYKAFAPDRNTAYLKHEVEPDMEVPTNLSVDAQTMTNYYPIPKGPLPPEGAAPVDIVPPPVIAYEAVKEGQTDA